jgi:ABC-type multidrug transport system permease subunit
MKGFLHHLGVTLKLNFRNPQAVVFGYVVPVFFLFAFAAFFGKARPKDPLSPYFAQLLTITVLGGACFGMPIAFVSERERGVWRRYRLTPMPTVAFVASIWVARYVLVLSAGLIQLGLAMYVYNMPFPKQPWTLLSAFTVVCVCFLGIGLIISMIANSTHAVQALGQSLFLPMIMIGGVGVPLSVLPDWAKNTAAFLPGRYAVQAMDACVRTVSATAKIYGPFNWVALVVIGVASTFAAAQLFRWENGQPLPARGLAWATLSVASWAAIGIFGMHYKLV